MRFLFVCRPGYGHWHQLVPLARALVQDGQDVAFATAPSARSQLSALGFTTFSAGIDERDPTTAAEFPYRPPNLPMEDRLAWQIHNVYADIAADRMVSDLLPLVARWRPDLIVRDGAEFGACVAAEYLGLPHATVQAGILHEAIVLSAQGPLNRLRVRLGLPVDPEMEMLHRYLLLYGAPRSLQVGEITLPATTHTLRPLEFDDTGDEGLPDWIDALPARPTIHFTLGTVANSNLWLFHRVIEGLGEAPVNAVVTVGRDNEPSDFGSLPDNVFIESFIPHTLLLPRCDLVISQGGYNTILKSLSNGLPLILIPLGADHPVNARRCVAQGVARVIDAKTLSPAIIRDAVTEVLNDPTYRRNAVKISREIAALPGPEWGAELLVRLAVGRVPLIATVGSAV